ncbi:hypothetical protein [Amycolatopsis cihanbeyliensis]|uniref:hypothetical protein n=1 Tax=Amycolatopsis cihanbeyliensis TaxID=1128664 RepID=UPI001B86A275|nr:hypothetical protein [Amycolatopsis cihanbeyliensis]
MLAELTADPGERSTADCLGDVVREATVFYASTVPITASLFAEPSLLRRHREAMRELCKFQRAFLNHFWMVREDPAALDAFAGAVVRTVLDGIHPGS